MGKKTKRNLRKPPKMATDEVCETSPAKVEGQDIIWFDSNPSITEQVKLIPLPETPVKPLTKKTKREESHGTVNENILAAISKLSLKHDATFQKISAIEKTTQATSRELDNLCTTVKQLVFDVGENKKELSRLITEVQTLQEANVTLKKALTESQRYNWKSFLKIHGLKELEGEHIRRRVLEILQQVATDLPADLLDAGVDVIHRLGPPPKDAKCRSIIIRFSLKRVRDAIWQASKKCKFLILNKLSITEPIPPEDRAAREKLWPLVEQARKQGKKASFKDSFALIDGKRYDYSKII